MKTNFNRLLIILCIVALSVGTSFAQETTEAVVNNSIFPILIVGLGIVAVLGLGFSARQQQKSDDESSE